MNDTSPILEAQGSGGARLLLLQDRLRIERKRAPVSLRFASISDIQIKKASFRRHYIEFFFINSAENKGVLVHFHDKTGIRFRSKHLPAFVEIKAAIEDRQDRSEMV